jgi:AcrR family transcriptional regulator
LRVTTLEGPSAVTIRRVAKELGGSTAVVTNYLGTREELLINAIRFAQEGWHRDAEAHLAGREGADRVRALAAWSCTTVEHDHAVRQLWLGLTGQYGRDSAALAVLREDAVAHRQSLVEALEDAEAAFADAGADALYLALRGFYFVSVEDPLGWTDERAGRAVARLAELLLGADDEPAGN